MTRPDQITLNDSQAKALDEIAASIVMKRPHLLTGYAGSGKTTLMQYIAARYASGQEIVLTAPTHKAVQVLKGKLAAAGIDVPCQTIHSLLSLRPKAQGDKQIFVRAPHARPVTADIVVIDEASMLDESMMKHIDRWLSGRAVLFCGDPAQLPPVGEKESRAFDVMPRSHLDTIVRQAEGNPILKAAHAIRECQGHDMAWDWARPDIVDRIGVFVPETRELDQWFERGFCSEKCRADPDHVRYLCWTNARVAEINARVRHLVHGRVMPEPFIADERLLMRAPHVQGNEILIATNEEVTVTDIEPRDWLGVPSWEIQVRTDAGVDHVIHSPRDQNVYQARLAELADQCKGMAAEWDDYHGFRQSFVRVQAVHALTVHNSQGSTFGSVFVDVSDIRKRQRDNLLEFQQLLYVAATRPTNGLILVGV